MVIYILEQNITISKLNAVYTACCFPNSKKMRDYLEQKHNAKVSFFTDGEDMEIRTKFKSLVDMKIVPKPKEFIKQLNDQNGKGTDKSKDKATRNIVGLFLGQELENRIAHTVCQRLIYLLTGVSLENIHMKYAEIRKEKVAPKGEVVFKMKQKVNRWTLDDDKTFVKMVLKHKIGKG